MLHTNLGRAPIAETAWHAVEQARSYCDFEYDFHAWTALIKAATRQQVLASTTGAEAGLAVNNCAAALLLMVTGLAGDRPTCISRASR